MRTTYPVNDLSEIEVIIISFLAEGNDCAKDSVAALIPMARHLIKKYNVVGGNDTARHALHILENNGLISCYVPIRGRGKASYVKLTENGFYNALIRRA